MSVTVQPDAASDGRAHASCLAEPSCLAVLLALLDRYCAGQRIDAHHRHDLRLIVEEACANVIAHAYRGGPPGPLTLRLDARRRRGRRLVEITVEDRGVPFDPLAHPAPDRRGPVADLPIGGLGIHLIRRLSDTQRYRHDPERGNVLVVTKFLDPAERAEPTRSGD